MNHYVCYLLVDHDTQWFTKLAKVDIEKPLNDAGEREAELTDVPSEVKGPFMENIYSRQSIAHTMRFNCDSTRWVGWALSGKEHDRIKRIVELLPLFTEYQKLISYP